MTDIITLQEAAALLNYKDIRSVEAWCERHQVVVMSDSGGKKKYLLRMQFDHARLKGFINFLKVKYGSDWLKAFETYTSMGITRVAELEEAGRLKIDSVGYKPTGQAEAACIERFTKKLKTL